MGYAIATVTGGLGDEAHYKVLAAIRTLALANGWTELRYVNVGDDRELILNSSGLSGTEDIYLGFKTYQSVGGDYYNMACAVFTGYVDENTFEAQPGVKITATPCHNNAVTYFLTANEQRIVGCFKVGTPVYTHFYVGKIFPYGRPGEFPSPLWCAGSFNGKQLKRFSDLDYHFPYYGYRAGIGAAYGQASAASYGFLRKQDGTWEQQYSNPWRNGLISLRPSGVNYQPQVITLYSYDNAAGVNGKGNVWGILDGVTQCTGFNNGTENVLQQGGTPVDQTGLTVLEAVDAIIAAGGRAHVVLQDTSRNAFNNYITLEMS